MSPVSALTAEEVMDLVRAAIVRVLEVDPASVTRDTRLADDLHADSLALVEIVDIVEEQIVAIAPGFAILDEDLDEIATVGEAVDYAVGRL